MKGISAVIAVVLILMITVALAAMAYVWFTGVFETISGSAGEAAEKTGQTIATSFDIASAGYNSTTSLNEYVLVYVTNTGTSDIDLVNMNVFVGVTKATLTNSGTMSPGDTELFAIQNSTSFAISCGQQVKVTYGSLERYTAILCE